MDMENKYRIYIIGGYYAECLVDSGDIDQFRAELEDGTFDIETRAFSTEAEQVSFVTGLYFGKDARAPAGFAVIYDDDMEDGNPFIDAIKELY